MADSPTLGIGVLQSALAWWAELDECMFSNFIGPNVALKLQPEIGASAHWETPPENVGHKSRDALLVRALVTRCY